MARLFAGKFFQIKLETHFKSLVPTVGRGAGAVFVLVVGGPCRPAIALTTSANGKDDARAC